MKASLRLVAFVLVTSLGYPQALDDSQVFQVHVQAFMYSIAVWYQQYGDCKVDAASDHWVCSGHGVNDIKAWREMRERAKVLLGLRD